MIVELKWVLVVHVVRVYISGGALKRTIGVSKVLLSFSVQVERYTMKAKKIMRETKQLTI